MNRIIYFAPIMMMKQKISDAVHLCVDNPVRRIIKILLVSMHVSIGPVKVFFVLNEEYKAANKADWYDFLFCR